MAKHTLKILRCEHCKTTKGLMTLIHYLQQFCSWLEEVKPSLPVYVYENKSRALNTPYKVKMYL